eukprot:m.73901 g.73901  ORF g.73901 m.73901 type:complete len:77 (+) comp11786_c0_seq1:69-299(+)
MLGVGEFVFLCGCGLVVIGPKGFPSFARNTGKLVGLSVRFMKRINQGVRNFSKEYQIAEVWCFSCYHCIDLLSPFQ